MMTSTRFASSIDFAGAVCQTVETSVIGVIEPSQWKSAALNLTFRRSGALTAIGSAAPISVPSRLAAFAM